MTAFPFCCYSPKVKTSHADPDPIPSQLKRLIVDLFRLDISEPEKITDHAPLIGGSLGLDSLDALELAICLEEKFGITIQTREESQSAFASIDSLTSYIQRRTQAIHSSPVKPGLSESPRKLAVVWDERAPALAR